MYNMQALNAQKQSSLKTYSAAVCESSDFWEKLWLRDVPIVWLLGSSSKLEFGRGGGSIMLGFDESVCQDFGDWSWMLKERRDLSAISASSRRASHFTRPPNCD